MIREVGHFLRHAPPTLRLKMRLGQAELYHTLMARADAAGIAAHRAALVADLAGDVLEIGAGTGLMFAHYPPAARVTAVELDETFAQTARQVAPPHVEVVGGDAGKLPFPDGRFDAVVIAYVLCSVPAVPSVLGEIRRVLRPGGEVRLLEHVRSDRAVAGSLMVGFNWLWRLLNGQGCNMHRRPLRDLEAAGFTIDDVVPFQVFSPGLPAFPMRRIRART